MSKEIKRPSTISKKKASVVWEFPLNKKDLMFVGIGIAVVILGYLLMTTGISSEPAAIDGKWNNPLAVTVAPLLLIIGYCVIIPLGILKFFSKKTKNTEVNAEANGN